jgi:DinB superfamily
MPYERSLERMRAGVAAWTRECAGHRSEVFPRQPAPGVWSVVQNTCHLADAFEATTTRATAMLAEDEPRLLSFDADRWAAERDYQSRPWPTALAGLHTRLAELLAVVGALTPAQLARTGRQHNIAVNILGLPTEVLTLADLVDFEADHVEEHLTSVRKILAEIPSAAG